MREPLPTYRALLREAEEWFSRAASVHAPEVRCRRGCDGCCRGLFDITPLDALLVQEGLRGADPSTRAALAAAARSTLDRVQEAAPGWGPPFKVGDLGEERFDALCEALEDDPCPALAGDGTCRLYPHRPLVCRLHGLPLYDPGEQAYRGGACALNLPPVGLAEKPALHFDHAGSERRELERMAEVAGPDAARAAGDAGTIIAAVVLDALSSPRSFGNNRRAPEAP